MAKLIDNLLDLNQIQKQWGTEVKRCFFIYDVTSDSKRGKHRHKKSRMALSCLNGTVRVYVQNRRTDAHYLLSRPEQCLLVEPEEWRIMYDFSPGAILLVYCSTPFDASDYIDKPYFQAPSLDKGFLKKVFGSRLWPNAVRLRL
ncbi:hypothetical protein GCM10023187_01480 [Nibrella viscosa]|uniref:Sugar 3,4-ketoisomerase QdtA cupin domain-containing protein n=1 Tax=Nibrella viscosa TaxID=1084524 RepID=A0ABP8JRT6_9BACT